MIGIFDSGMGGLTVLARAVNELPNENYIYVGDSINAPYGTKSKNEIIRFSEKICDYLIDKYNVKAIVIACNTATSVAVKTLRKKYSIPIIGMEPAIKPALKNSDNKKILVLATETTLQEEKYNELIKKYNGKERIISLPCSKLVNEIEKANENNYKTKKYVDLCLGRYEKIDAIVLGCTHFLFIKKHIIDKYSKIRLYDGNSGTIDRLNDILVKNSIKNFTKNRGNIIIENTENENKKYLSEKLFKKYSKVIKNG